MAYANPVEELKALRHELDTFTKSVNAGDDIPAEKAARIDTVLARSAELAEAVQRAEKSAGEMRRVAGDFIETANLNSALEAKGFLTPEAIKRTARTGGVDGAKALIAGGSMATPVALDTVPVKLGVPGVNLGLLNVLQVIKRDTPKYSYLRQTVRTNNAAVVEPGALKPTSVFTLANVDNELDVVAHESEYIDKYLIRDNDNLETFVQNEMTDGLFAKVTALGVTTFAGTAGITTQAFQGNVMDSIYLGAAKASDLGYAPDVLLISRADYDTLMLAKDGQGNYLYRNAEDSRLHGLQPVIVTGLAAKSALVLDSNRVAISTDKIGLVTEWDKLTRKAYNAANVLVEGRFSFDVFSPASIVKVGTAAA